MFKNKKHKVFRIVQKKMRVRDKRKVKYLRDRVKKIISSVNTKFLMRNTDEMKEDIKKAGFGICGLLDLVKEFSDMFDEEKKRRRIADYGDLEHYCLKALIDGSYDNPVKSQAAEELTSKYAYVMTDEYQDSNAVQELILSLVSGERNRFMVGDVKQSIYSFRLANPDIFAEKYNTYSLEKGAEKERIDMFKNFRSRKEVLDGINYIFMQIMQKELGGVEYDKNAMLYYGADYPMYTGTATAGGAVEIDVINTDDDSEDDYTNIEKEMNFVADRINSLMYGKDRMEVYDRSTKCYRELKFSDIVIIMRNKTHGAEFVEILESKGIPASTESNVDFLETTEVMTALSFLRIIDNPRQDIPFAAVLTSCFGKLTSEELANIQCEGEGKTFYERALFYLGNGSDENLKERITDLLRKYERFRRKVPYTAIHTLLWDIIEETGYGDYVASLPSGEQRKANLEMLVEKAVSFESTSYKGLFHFIRYIEQLHKYDVDYGEASVLDEQADTVRLMSIHKSKGLEFPIVFVSGMSKRFNTQDIKGSIVIHSEFGVGIDAVDVERRTKAPTLLKRMIQRDVLMENAGEELRVLYVALTRAKEKLIMTGTISNLEQKIRSYEGLRSHEETELTFSRLTKANSYFDWVLPALYRHASFAPILETYNIGAPFMNPLYDRDVPIRVYKMGIGEIVAGEVAEELSGQYTKELLHNWDDTRTYDEQMKEQLEIQFGYQYPYERERKLKQKMTVSELKKRAYLEEEAGELVFDEADVVPLLPKFLQEEEELTGASRGSAYHRLLELLDFSKKYDEVTLKELIEEQKRSGKLSEEMCTSIREKDILRFLNTPVGERMHRAAVRGTLWAEQPFVLGIDADELYKGKAWKKLFSFRESSTSGLKKMENWLFWIIRQTECSKKRY